MKPSVTVVTGPARAGKTHALLDRYCDAVSGATATTVGRRLWVAPNSRAAAAVRERLMARAIPGLLAPGITTFADLARQIAIASGIKLRPLPPVARRELMRRVVAGAVQTAPLKFFAEAARRAGFIDLVAAHIRELKENGMTPRAYSRIAAARGHSQREQELAALYEAYERELATHALCDEEGLHHAARDALANGACPRFAELDLVIVDGFTDFTRTQFETLEHLASRASATYVSLPIEAASRDDLFAKPRATLASLKIAFPKLSVKPLEPRGAACAALDHLATNVFRFLPPEPAQTVLDSLDRIEIVEGAGAHDEIVQIARRIKARLSASERRPGHMGPAVTKDGSAATRPGDILVVFRSLSDVAPRIEEVFTTYGIPFWLETSPRIASAPIYKTLASLLRLDGEDWPFRRTVAVFTNNRLTCISDAARRAADWLVRDLQIASGRRQLLDAVMSLAAREQESPELGERHERRVAAAATALPALEHIAAAFDALPREATLAEWSAALEAFAAKLGIELLSGPEGAPLVPPIDTRAWGAIRAHFASLERFESWLGESPRKLARRELLSTLTDVATREALPRAHDDVGRVRVLSAHTARSVPARHLFLAGMSEQSFPAMSSAGQLASGADYRFLAAAAHQGDSPTPSIAVAPTQAQDEMLLFYEVLSRADQTLTISYPAMDDKAQVLPPSPYVVELQRLFRSAERRIPTAPPQLSPVPRPAALPRDGHATHPAFSVSEWRRAALAAGAQTDGDRLLLAGVLSFPDNKALGAAIGAGVRIVHARARGNTFGPCEGVLTSPAAASQLRQRFGPQHAWSPSQFETYAACPYKFFLHDVLGLEPLGELSLETDFARRGSLLHQVLAAFHRKYRASSAGEWAAFWGDETRFTAELKRALAAAMGEQGGEGIDAALRELDRRQIDKWTDLYRAQHEKYGDAWKGFTEPPRPAHFELRFGRKHPGDRGDEDSRSVNEAFQLDIGDEKINIVGRIDRIDVGRAGERLVFNVIDYKSGRRPALTKEKIESGERLQPALYVMAAQALVFRGDDAVPLWAGYWSMQGGVNTQEKNSLRCLTEVGKVTKTWEDLQPKIIARIREIVAAARQGEFPIASSDQQCTSFCDYRTVCRVSQVRSAKKVWAPAATPAAD